MRLIAVTIGTFFVAGCSSSPSTPNVVAEVPAAAASAPDGTTASTPAPTYLGYKVRQQKGRTVYCKKMSQTGTRFVDEICMTEPQLKRFMEQAEKDREEVRRAQGKCGMGGCGGDSG